MAEFTSNKLKLVIIDIDGVMCDGKIYDSDGNVTGKIFKDLDFSAIKAFRAMSVAVIFLSSDRFNEGMAKQRDIPFYYSRTEFGVINKLGIAKDIIQSFGVTKEETAFIGDDVYDLDLLEYVGYSFCPSNASEVVRSGTRIILNGRSGEELVSKTLDWFIQCGILEVPNIPIMKQLDAEQYNGLR